MEPFTPYLLPASFIFIVKMVRYSYENRNIRGVYMNENPILAENNERKEEEAEKAFKIHGEEVAELRKRQLSNTENYDKTITMLSSAGLALSLTVITKIATVESIREIGYLYSSWLFYSIAIFTGLIAYVISNKCIDYQINIADQYYLQGDNEAREKKRPFIFKLNDMSNCLTGISFLIALGCTIMFMKNNIGDNSVMNDDQKPSKIKINAADLNAINSATPIKLRTVPASEPTGEQQSSRKEAVKKSSESNN